MSDEYELLPAEELARLRKEVEQLKANPLGGTEENKTLLQSIEQLNVSINKLIRVYGDIKQDMMDEYEKVKAVDEQFSDLKEQNKKIATGVLTVAKMLQDHHERVHNSDRLEAPSFNDEEPMRQQVQQQAPPQEQPQTPPSPFEQQAPPAFSTLPQEQQPHNDQDPFSHAMQQNKPSPTPIDPWAPSPQPEQPPQAPPHPEETWQPTAAPQPEQPPRMPSAPPPPPKKRRGLFS